MRQLNKEDQLSDLCDLKPLNGIYKHETVECVNEHAAKHMRIDFCDWHSHMVEKQTCYQEVAVAKNDPYICGQLNTEYHRGECYSIVSIALDDFDVCLLSFNWQGALSRCAIAFAIQHKDPSFCEAIPIDLDNESYRVKFAEIYKDHKHENEKYKKWKEDCIATATIVTHEGMEALEEYKTQEGLKQCSSKMTAHDKIECISDLAHTVQNATVCDELFSETHRARCLTYFASRNPAGGKEVCSTMTSSLYRDYCMLQLAFLQNEERLCSEVKHKRMHTHCKKFAMPYKTSVSPHICELSSRRSVCIHNLARTVREVDICFLVEDVEPYGVANHFDVKPHTLCKHNVPFTRNWLAMYLVVFSILLPLIIVLFWFARKNKSRVFYIGFMIGSFIGITYVTDDNWGLLLPWFWPILPLVYAVQHVPDILLGIPRIESTLFRIYIILSSGLCWSFLFGLLRFRKTRVIMMVTIFVVILLIQIGLVF